MKKVYSWIYNTYNDNEYVLLVIIILLGLIVYNFDYWKQNTSIDTTITNTNNTQQKVKKDQFYNVMNSGVPEQTPYQAPMETNPANYLFISDEEKAQWKVAQSILDGNEDSLQNTNGTMNQHNPQNDIMQVNSTLFGPGANNTDKTNASINVENYSTVGDYATLDSLGKGLTDTLGGIPTSLGYTLLDEQLGTFKKQAVNNPYTYDNTSNYNTGLNANTVDGNERGRMSSHGSGKFLQDNKPVFLQKDFDGVSNIFAPNIIIQNPPLTSDGYPDISFQM